jgi:hypothetical protein
VVHPPEPDPQRQRDDTHTVEQVAQGWQAHVAKTASGWLARASSMR